MQLITNYIIQQFKPFTDSKKIKLYVVFSPALYELKSNIYTLDSCQMAVEKAGISTISLHKAFFVNDPIMKLFFGQ
jgi:hypothetical protein